MTDDLKAPERIWVSAPDSDNEVQCWCDPDEGGTEYIRADRIAALEAALADMTQQRDAAMAGAVKVRELVWKEEPRNGWKRGVSHAAGYHLIRRDDGWHYGNHDGGIFDTIEAAKAAAQADYEARIMSALIPDPDRMLALTAAAEPVCYLPTKTVEWLDTYDGPACATRTAVHNRPIKTDGGVPVYRIPANALAALSRIEAQAEARGMRKAAEHFAANALGRTVTSMHREILALADATEAAAKGGV